MIRLIVKRLAAAVVIVLALTAGMFILQKVTPVDPVHAMLGAQVSGPQILAEQHKLGLDRPLANFIAEVEATAIALAFAFLIEGGAAVPDLKK